MSMANYKQHCIKLLQIIDTNWPAGLPTTWEKWANAARADLTNSKPLRPMTDLSPAAQTVWDAFNEDEAGVFVDYGDKLAAALRAAADQVVPEFWHEEGDIYAETKHDVRADLLAIADELEGAND